MSRSTLYPHAITPDSIDDLLDFHHRHFGGMTMNGAGAAGGDNGGTGGGGAGGGDNGGTGGAATEQQEPARPDGVTEEEWNSLGDPGRRAIVRERKRAETAERNLAARTARPGPPAGAAKPEEQQQAGAAGGGQQQPKAGEVDIDAIVQKAVAAAVAPFKQAEDERAATEAATKIQDAVLERAGELFHDATDALAQVDLTALTDGNAGPDRAKIDKALEDLLTRKPHLGKTDGRRYAEPGSGAGTGGGSAAPLETRVQETLRRMQNSAGIRPASS